MVSETGNEEFFRRAQGGCMGNGLAQNAALRKG